MDGEERHRSGGCKECLGRLWQKLFEKDIDILHEAIRKGDLDKVKYFHLIKKTNFNQYIKTGDSPLLLAARYRKFEILKYILRKIPGVIRDDKSFQGDTALMIATFNNDIDMVRYLVEEEDFEVNCRDNKGFTPFIAACANNLIELVSYFRFFTNADVTARSYDKQSAAHRAAYYGHLETLIFLGTYTDIRLNQPDKRGNLPIHYAAMNSHFAVVRWFFILDPKSIEKRNKSQQYPEEIIKESLDKIKKMKNPTAEVTREEVRAYIANPDKRPFTIEPPKKKEKLDQQSKKLELRSEGDKEVQNKNKGETEMQNMDEDKQEDSGVFEEIEFDDKDKPYRPRNRKRTKIVKEGSRSKVSSEAD